MLGLAALGNLMMPYSSDLRYALGSFSFIILLLVVAKTASAPGELLAAFKQPVVASVLPAFSMGMAILCGYLRPFMPQTALILWFTALFIHLCLIVTFSAKYVADFSIRNVFPSWFVVYVGLATFSVTAPAFGQLEIGQVSFWFAFASYAILMPIVIYRMTVIKDVHEPLLPTIAIFTAPSSLALAGYLSSFPNKNFAIISFLTVCTLISFAVVIRLMPRLLKLPFNPCYSAFTFPFVITAIALKGASRVGIGSAVLSSTVQIFELWALIMVLYVLWRFTVFLIGPRPAHPQVAKKEMSEVL